MSAAAISSREQTLAGALAFATHVLFLILLVFGVSWQHKQIDTAVVVDLWRDLPATAPPKVEPPAPVVKPEPPPPAPKVEVKPPPKPEPAPVIKPDIALKEKLEKERKLKEQAAAEAKQRAAEKAREEAVERKERAETEALKKKRAEAELLKKKQAAEAETKRAQAEQEKMRATEAAQRAAAQSKEIDKYRLAIAARIKRFIIEPPNIQGNPVAELNIIILPGGEVLDVRTKKPSGQAAWDNACERAIRRAQPLPLPPDPALMNAFRELSHLCRYKD